MRLIFLLRLIVIFVLRSVGLKRGFSQSNDISGGQDSKKRRVFKEPTDESNFGVLEKKQFAPESKKKIKWAVNMYSEWRKNRVSYVGVSDKIVRANLDCLHTFDKADLSYALSKFVTEIKRLDGKDYPPNTIRENRGLYSNVLT